MMAGMGRPPIGKRPMTARERQQRHRAGLSHTVTKPAPVMKPIPQPVTRSAPVAPVPLTLDLFREDPEEAARWLLRELGGSALCDIAEAIDRVMESETPKGHPKRIVEKFADAKWHSLPVIA